MMRWSGPAVALGVLLWIMTGLMVVDTGEVSVVFRFGAIVRTQTAGLGLRAPWPFERDERINLTEVRRVEPASHRILTGDYNLVQMRLVVQYTVSDAVGFTLSVADPESVISSEVMGAATRVAASVEVDVLLTSGRSALERSVLEIAQRELDALQMGVRLVAADVAELGPPAAVVDAFNDVSSARGDRETLALGAEAYASKSIPDKRGQAARMRSEARGRASQILATARGDVARFRSLLTAAKGNRHAVSEDLRIRTLERVAPRLDIVVVPPGSDSVRPLSKTAL